MRRIFLLAGLLLPVASPIAISADAQTRLTVEQRLERLERRAARITDLTLAVDSLRRDNSRLQGEIDRLRHELAQLQRKQRDIYLDVDQRLSALQAGTAPAATGPSAGAAAAPSGSAGPATPKSEPPAKPVDGDQMQADYKAAYALLSPQQRRYDEAAKAFRQFLEKYPGSPLAANAHYWLGEAYYVSQKNAEAKAAFEQLVEKYPGSAKVPGALYKIGRIKAAEGDRAGARQIYERVLKEYASSPAAGLAREQLKRLSP